MNDCGDSMGRVLNALAVEAMKAPVLRSMTHENRSLIRDVLLDVFEEDAGIQRLIEQREACRLVAKSRFGPRRRRRVVFPIDDRSA